MFQVTLALAETMVLYKRICRIMNCGVVAQSSADFLEVDGSDARTGRYDFGSWDEQDWWECSV
jgi:hypothetical protein